jgi:transcription elongation factor GreB
MSRAFVKEGDGEELDDPPPRPARVQPCYMTAEGVAALRRELEQLQAAAARPELVPDLTQQAAAQRALRRIRELTQILQEAVPVATGLPHSDHIRFGATVELQDAAGHTHRFQIVGEDEAAPAAGRISWVSPLGRQLIGKAVGDEVVWPRPVGELRLEVLAFE